MTRAESHSSELFTVTGSKHFPLRVLPRHCEEQSHEAILVGSEKTRVAECPLTVIASKVPFRHCERKFHGHCEERSDEAIPS